MNPFFKKSELPFEAPEFDSILTEHYLPAFEEGIRQAKAEVEAIVSNPESPDFRNTVEALEFSGRLLDRVSGIFYNLLEADTDDEMQEIAEKVSPLMTEFSTYVSHNEKLFARVKYVYENIGTMTRTPEEKRLVTQSYRSFVRHGVNLSSEDKALYSKYIEELSLLSLKFGKNVLDATNAYILNLTDRDALAGVPETVLERAAEDAAEKGLEGWAFTLDRASYGPFMKYCSDPVLRKRMYMEYNSRGKSGDSDNTRIVFRIAELRRNVANLLGFKSWADYVLEENMAGNADTVNGFLSDLMESSLPYASEEVRMLYDYALNHGFREQAERTGSCADCLMPWDFSYWAEKCQKSMFSIDSEQLKPYFRLEKCVEAVFSLAGKLYGISFEQRTDLPVYHKDVKVYEVNDPEGRHLALLYADFFCRPSKRSGAWMTEFRGQRIENGVESRPVISIVMNFTKPTTSSPSLLSLDEFVTFLHEFGHSLHGMLTRGHYTSLCGTNVARDFVELPSQLMENWAYEPEYLKSFARHYVSGDPLPESMIKGVVDAKNYLSGYYQVRQLNFGILDMAWHSSSYDTDDVQQLEQEVLSRYDVLPRINGTSISTSFNHIFSGGYSAGYYSYKWAEVLEADAFEYFKEKGLFGGEAADSFRTNILEKGDSEDPSILYRHFRGRAPQSGALLRKLGLGNR